MSKTKRAKNQTDVPTLAEVAPKSSSQRLSSDFVVASLVRKGPAKNGATSQEAAFEQVRELLMGETIQSLREDLNASHRIILQRVDELGTSATSQLEALETKVTLLSSDVAGEVLTRKSFADTHLHSMEITAAELQRELADLTQSAERAMAKLTEDFGQQSSFQTKAIENFERAMSSQLAEKGRDLDGATVAKEQLATMLFAAATAFAEPEAAVDAPRT